MLPISFEFRPFYGLLLRALALLVAVSLSGCSGGGGKNKPKDPPITPGATVGDVNIQPFVGTKRFLFIVAKFNDDPGLFAETAEDLNKLQKIVSDVAGALEADSFGGITPVIDYTWPPVLIDRSVDSYPAVSAHMEVRSDAIAAARAAGWEAGDYDREVVFCTKVWEGAAARGWVRTAWMSNTISWVVFHEIGHTLNRDHADFWDGDPTDTGDRVNYGDIYDPMGTGRQWSAFHHSGPWFKLRAGWLERDQIEEVTQSGEFTLSPLEKPDTSIGPAALLIRRNALFDYWIAQRSKEPLVASGVVIIRTQRRPYAGTVLLDMNPGGSGQPELEVMDAGLGVGQVFDDSVKNSITVENISPPGDQPRRVRVTVDEARQAGLDQLPIFELVSPKNEDGPLSGVVEFEILAHDPDMGPTDGEGVAKVTFGIGEPTSDPAVILASKEFTSRPYKWELDTVAAGLRNTVHQFVVKLESESGTRVSFSYRMMVDNYTGTAPLRGVGVRRVSLAVADDEGGAIPGARIAVTTPGRERIALADAAGIAHFEFTDEFETLRFEGTVSAPGFLTRGFVARATGAGRSRVENDFRPNVRESVVLDRPTTAAGTVLDADGRPSSGARIRIAQLPKRIAGTCTVGDSPTKVWETTADEYGRFHLTDLPAGRSLTWTVADAAGERDATRRIALDGDFGTPEARLELALAPSTK